MTQCGAFPLGFPVPWQPWYRTCYIHIWMSVYLYGIYYLTSFTRRRSLEGLSLHTWHWTKWYSRSFVLDKMHKNLLPWGSAHKWVGREPPIGMPLTFKNGEPTRDGQLDMDLKLKKKKRLGYIDKPLSKYLCSTYLVLCVFWILLVVILTDNS